MNAAIYYTLTQHGKDHLPAFSGADRARLNKLYELLQKGGHHLHGIYITDPSPDAYHAQHQLLQHDARQHRFDLLYLYLYGSPAAITADALSYILNLPIDGGTSMFNQKLIGLAEMLTAEKPPVS